MPGRTLKYEGPLALQTSFQTLGLVAAQDVFTNPDLAAVISGLEKCLDGEKLKSSLGILKKNNNSLAIAARVN